MTGSTTSGDVTDVRESFGRSAMTPRTGCDASELGVETMAVGAGKGTLTGTVTGFSDSGKVRGRS